MSEYIVSWRRGLSKWQKIYNILRILNRREELVRLNQWARRKRLSGPLRLYQNRLADEERRLLRFAVASPRSLRYARLLHRLNQWISPVPRYLSKGSASMYRTGKA